MLNQDQIIKDFFSWSKNFLEKPNKSFGGWMPCPYIRNSRLNNKLHISFTSLNTINNDINNSLNLLADKDCVALLFDHTEINLDEADDTLDEFNIAMMPHNFVMIIDHPDRKEDINNEGTNFGKCGIILLFKLDHLNKLASTLKEKGYFSHWPKGRYENTIAWRHNTDLTKAK
jgi:hypothetical protein